MIGKLTDVANLTREEAAVWIKYHCCDCELCHNCNGADSAICDNKVKYLTEKYKNVKDG